MCIRDSHKIFPFEKKHDDRENANDSELQDIRRIDCQNIAQDLSLIHISVIDMPAGHGHVTLTFNVSSYGANNWTPTTSISDLLVVCLLYTSRCV